ncbi:hypothetical protein AcV5_002988 [Taiwanofungus camphoratus]|nr:hypothetical protein AcV5_002988 [Antrodia cinnamomea]
MASTHFLFRSSASHPEQHMAHQRASVNESDDDAPEVFSFGSSRKAAQGEQDSLQQFRLAEKSKQKQKNRERDRVLKERAEQAKARAKTKGKAKEVENRRVTRAAEDDESEGKPQRNGGRDDLEARMERAMREAAEESDSDSGMEGPGSRQGSPADDSETGDGDGTREENSEGARDEDVMSEVNEDEDDAEEGLSDNGEEESSPPSRFSASHNYLPDHVFESAFSTMSGPSLSSRRSPPTATLKSTPKKRKRVKRSSKDMIIGYVPSTCPRRHSRWFSTYNSSRTIRTLSTTTHATSLASSRTMPPALVNKFLKRSLNVKGDAAKSKIKGWERRPANLGIMKRSGPAASFVRHR